MAGDLVGDIFGYVGSLISTYFFLAPVVPILKLIKGESSVKDTPGILLICSLLNCILWAMYGLLKDRFLQYAPNGLGGSITLIWITIYLIYLGDKKILFALLFNCCLTACTIGLCLLFYFAIDAELTGKIVLIFNVLMYAAPGEKMYTVCKTGNYKLIPIWSTIGAAACSGCWLIYGIYVGDIYVIIPNALGVICSIIQLIVYSIYKNKNVTPGGEQLNEDDPKEEE
jgi:solute carrier family 50 protein (sugar transporter)